MWFQKLFLGQIINYYHPYTCWGEIINNISASNVIYFFNQKRLRMKRIRIQKKRTKYYRPCIYLLFLMQSKLSQIYSQLIYMGKSKWQCFVFTGAIYQPSKFLTSHNESLSKEKCWTSNDFLGISKNYSLQKQFFIRILLITFWLIRNQFWGNSRDFVSTRTC